MSPEALKWIAGYTALWLVLTAASEVPASADLAGVFAWTIALGAITYVLAQDPAERKKRIGF